MRYLEAQNEETLLANQSGFYSQVMEESMLKGNNQSDLMLLDIFNNDKMIMSPRMMPKFQDSNEQEEAKGTASFAENFDSEK